MGNYILWMPKNDLDQNGRTYRGFLLKGLSLIPFGTLMVSKYAKRGYGWLVNPWVWVVSFKVVSR